MWDCMWNNMWDRTSVYEPEDDIDPYDDNGVSEDSDSDSRDRHERDDSGEESERRIESAATFGKIVLRVYQVYDMGRDTFVGLEFLWM
jgi:hypothetical protein